MRTKFIILISLIALSCSKDEDAGCKCNGEFKRFNQEGSFFVDGVDCETGQPALDQQSTDGNAVFYLGCAD